jgi:hypothetical protein
VNKETLKGVKKKLHTQFACFVAEIDSFPFQLIPENLVQIHKAEFTCPPWFSPAARRFITQILDPNPKTVSVGCCSNPMFFSNISAALEIMSEAQYGFVVCCVVTRVRVCVCVFSTKCAKKTSMYLN